MPRGAPPSQFVRRADAQRDVSHSFDSHRGAIDAFEVAWCAERWGRILCGAGGASGRVSGGGMS